MKRLVVLVVLCLMFLPIMAKAQTDTLKYMLSITGWGIFPAFDVAPVYDPDLGMGVYVEKTLGKNITGGVSYMRWKAKGQSIPDLKGQTVGLKGSYWFYDIGSKYNLCLTSSFAGSQINDGTEKDDEFSLITSVGTMIKLFHSTYFRANCSVIKYGDDQDALTLDLGLTFKL